MEAFYTVFVFFVCLLDYMIDSAFYFVANNGINVLGIISKLLQHARGHMFMMFRTISRLFLVESFPRLCAICTPRSPRLKG